MFNWSYQQEKMLLLEAIGCHIRNPARRVKEENNFDKLSPDLQYALSCIHGGITEPSLPDNETSCICL